MCLKALILYESGKREEGRTLCNEGLRNALSSFVAWELTSRIREHDGDVPEAIKCMRMAIAKDPETERASELRAKLSMVQFIAQDYVGFLETRLQILNGFPEESRNWGPCAIGAQLMGDVPTAIAMIDMYVDAVRSDLAPAELSEILFYKGQLLSELGDLNGALAHLEKEEFHLVEKKRLLEERVRLRLKIGDAKGAEPFILSLLDMNADDTRLHKQLAEARQVTTVDGFFDLYSELIKRYPKSITARRELLDCLPGSDARFKTVFLEYLRPLLQKGAPSAFASVKGLYADNSKVKVIESALLENIASLRSSGKFVGDASETSPTTLLWALFFAAQHYDRLRDWTEALRLIDEAIAHTPTLIDLYICKARIAKHCGDSQKAYQLTDWARELDTADRWLNWVSVRHALAVDKLAEAEFRIGLFARAEDGVNNVFEMQNQRYVLHLGVSYFRQRKFPQALKVLLEIEKFYNQYSVDHFELMRFSMSSGTLVSWVELGRYLRECRNKPTFVKAIGLVVDIYLTLARQQRAQQNNKAASGPSLEQLEVEWQKLSPKSRKQARNNYKKAQDEKAAAENAKSTSASDAKSLTFAKSDSDPIGLELAAQDPLAQAYKYVKLLLKASSSNADVQVLAGRVAVARGRLVQAMGHYSSARLLNEHLPGVHALAVEILHLAQSVSDAQVASFFTSQRNALFGDAATTAAYLKNWEAKASDVTNRLARAQVLLYTLNDAKGAAAALTTGSKPEKHELRSCLDVLAFLNDNSTFEDTIKQWKDTCIAVFPAAVAFGGAGVATPELNIVDEQANSKPVAN